MSLPSHKPFQCVVQAPSNIALVKYWGKKKRQLPENPSISFTLKKCKTQILMIIEESKHFEIDLLFEGKKSKAFEEKLDMKLTAMMDLIPWLERKKIRLESKNTFPHSAGIASSASSMAAVAYGLAQYQKEVLKKKASFNDISSWARILSGSAARSLQGPVMLWGELDNQIGSNEFASIVENVHPLFQKFKDAIIIISDEEKEISSTVGHSLMNGHPFKKERYLLAKDHTRLMLKALKEGDLNLFGHVLEQEALSLHGMMMTSDPAYILMKPKTLEIIQKLKEFRDKDKIPCYFTLDAGPNLHLLYPDYAEKAVQDFIKSLNINAVLWDEVGGGASCV